MTSFEYVMVIVSIIMGLGITVLLSGTVNALRADSGWKPGLLHSLWIANILVLHVGIWSIRWSGERRSDWPFSILLAFLLLPVLLYAVAELLFPREPEEVGLSDYFMSNRRTFFALSAMIWLTSLAGPFVFYEGVDPFTGARGQVVPYMLLAAASCFFAFSSNRRLHIGWAGVHLLVLLLAFGTLEVA